MIVKHSPKVLASEEKATTISTSHTSAESDRKREREEMNGVELHGYIIMKKKGKKETLFYEEGGVDFKPFYNYMQPSSMTKHY